MIDFERESVAIKRVHFAIYWLKRKLPVRFEDGDDEFGADRFCHCAQVLFRWSRKLGDTSVAWDAIAWYLFVFDFDGRMPDVTNCVAAEWLKALTDAWLKAGRRGVLDRQTTNN